MKGTDRDGVAFRADWGILSLGREDGSRFRANAHLSDDETVAKMGHPNLFWVRPEPPAECPPSLPHQQTGGGPEFCYDADLGHRPIKYLCGESASQRAKGSENACA
jgi:hypothetical protein